MKPERETNTVVVLVIRKHADDKDYYHFYEMPEREAYRLYNEAGKAIKNKSEFELTLIFQGEKFLARDALVLQGDIPDITKN